MTAQEVFDKIVAHLRAQAAKSVQGFSCKYRGPNGTKCAVGCLIPDEQYRPEMEGIMVDDLISRGWLPEYLIPHQKLLCDMQRVHDQTRIENWEADFLMVAQANELRYTNTIK